MGQPKRKKDWKMPDKGADDSSSAPASKPNPKSAQDRRQDKAEVEILKEKIARKLLENPDLARKAGKVLENWIQENTPKKPKP